MNPLGTSASTADVCVQSAGSPAGTISDDARRRWPRARPPLPRPGGAHHRHGDRRRAADHGQHQARHQRHAFRDAEAALPPPDPLGQPPSRLDGTLQPLRGIVDGAGPARLQHDLFFVRQLPAQLGRQHLGRGALPPARLLAEDDLVHDRAQRPQIRPDAGTPAAQQLGRHVRDGAAGHAGRAVARVGRQAEVRQHDAPVGHAQQVLRRQIAVDDPGLMNRRQRRRHRARVGDARRQRPRPERPRLDLVAQRPLRRQLHHQEHAAVRVLEIEHAADVGVLDLARQLHLARQPRRPDLLARQLGAHDLDRDRLLQIAIVRAHDDARPAPPQHLFDRVAAAQHHPVADRNRLGEVGPDVLQLRPAVFLVVDPVAHAATPFLGVKPVRFLPSPPGLRGR